MIWREALKICARVRTGAFRRSNVMSDFGFVVVSATMPALLV